MQRQVYFCVLVVAILSGSAGSSFADFFTFTPIVSTGDTIGGKKLTGLTFDGLHSFNDGGDATFIGTFAGGTGIFTQHALLAQSGASIGGKTLSSFNLPVINNSGEVAFIGFAAGGTGIFTSSSLIAAIGSSIAGKTLTSVHQPSISDAGTVIFRGLFTEPGGGGSGVFSQSGLLVRGGSLVDGTTLGGIHSPPTPAINDIDDYAFIGAFSGGPGLFRTSSLLVEAGATIGGQTLHDPFAFSIGQLAMNDSGVVAFRAELASGGAGLFTQDELIAATGMAFGSKTLTVLTDRPAINDWGEIAFIANFVSGQGIFTTSAGLVIEIGDKIGAKTISSLSAPAVNNAGDLVFLAGFTDSSESLVLAQSTAVVPEPSSLGLCFLGCVCLIGSRIRSRLAR